MLRSHFLLGNVREILGEPESNWKLKEIDFDFPPAQLILCKVEQFRINFRFWGPVLVKLFQRVDTFFNDRSKHGTIEEWLAEAEKTGALDVDAAATLNEDGSEGMWKINQGR